jgi:pyruvate carboxylase
MKEQSYKVINDYSEQYLTKREVDSLNLISIGKEEYHVIDEGIAYRIKVLSKSGNKSMKLEINGNEYEVLIQDNYDLLIDRMGLKLGSHHKSGDIKAPMPGLVLKVLVEEGQEVHEETPLFILEAMKMENVIKSHGEGVVQSINVPEGTKVEKGQLIIQIA